jgi:hypothetical protein
VATPHFKAERILIGHSERNAPTVMNVVPVQGFRKVALSSKLVTLEEHF